MKFHQERSLASNGFASYCVCDYSGLYDSFCRWERLADGESFGDWKPAGESNGFCGAGGDFGVLLSSGFGAAAGAFAAEAVGAWDSPCSAGAADSGGGYALSAGEDSFSGVSACGLCLCFFGASFVLHVFDGMEIVWAFVGGEAAPAALSRQSGFNYWYKRSASGCGRDCQHGAGGVFYSYHNGGGAAAFGSFRGLGELSVKITGNYRPIIHGQA